MAGGYIKLHRKVMDSEIWVKPAYFFKLWAFILMRANFAEDGRLEPGECLVTMRELQEAGSYRMGYRRIMLTRDQVRGFLRYLRTGKNDPDTETHMEPHMETAMATVTATTQGYRIKVLKYGIYQGSEINGDHDGDHMDTQTETARSHTRSTSPSLYKKKRRKKKEYVSPYIPQEGDTENNSYHDVVPFWDPNPAEEPTEEETAAFYARHKKG